MWRLSVSRRVLVLTAAASAGAGLGVGTLSACSSGGAQTASTVPAAAAAPAAVAAPVFGSSPSPSSTSPSSASPSSPAPSAPRVVSADQASAIAVRTSPGTVTEVDRDDEDTGTVFDVTVRHRDGSETKVEVDAASGRVLSTKTEAPDYQDEQQEQPGDGH